MSLQLVGRCRDTSGVRNREERIVRSFASVWPDHVRLPTLL